MVMPGRPIGKRTHWKNLRNNRGLREKKKKDFESHTMFQSGTETNRDAKDLFQKYIPFICSKYKKLCVSYGVNCTQDDIQSCLLGCWRKLRSYDPELGKPITFLAVCVKRCLFTRFEYEKSRPIEYSLKLKPPLSGLRDYMSGFRDQRIPFEEVVDNQDELRRAMACASDEETAYLRWYFARPSRTAYDHAKDPPPLPIPPNMTARFYTERKRMIIDRIRKRMGLLSPSE
jgi:DNA-directed RNA polymerase specialized sigma24 family protein